MNHSTITGDEYQVALSMANESARIRIHRLQGTDNVWHMRGYPVDMFLTMFDLEELRDMLNIILRDNSPKKIEPRYNKLNDMTFREGMVEGLRCACKLVDTDKNIDHGDRDYLLQIMQGLIDNHRQEISNLEDHEWAENAAIETKLTPDEYARREIPKEAI